MRVSIESLQVYNELKGANNLILYLRVVTPNKPTRDGVDLAFSLFNDQLNKLKENGPLTQYEDLNYHVFKCTDDPQNCFISVQNKHGLVASIRYNKAREEIQKAWYQGMSLSDVPRNHANSDWKFSLATNTWQLDIPLAQAAIGRIEHSVTKWLARVMHDPWHGQYTNHQTNSKTRQKR